MLISLAIDHHGSDLETRERLARSAGISPHLGAPLEEMLLLSTCNRFELYASVSGEVEAGWKALAACWPENPEAGALLLSATRRAGDAAAAHLLRVAAGLESQLAGDGHILVQVRRAYTEAIARGTIGPVLHRLLQAALQAGRRVQRETGFTRRGRSAATEAAALIERRAAASRAGRIVILGAGKLASQAARRLRAVRDAELVIVNRSADAACALATEVGGRSAPLESLHREVAEAGFAVLASASDAPLVRRAQLVSARAGRDEPLLVLDLGLPRNAEAGVGGAAGVELINLEQLALAEEAPSAADRAGAEAIVAEAVEEMQRRRARQEARRASLPSLLPVEG